MRFSDKVLPVVALLLACACAGTDSDASGSERELASSQQTLRRAYGPLRAELAQIVDKGPPAAVALVRKDGQLTWSSAGVADLRSRRTPQRDDRFRIASVTKPFVAVVVLQLEAEGKLRLDDLVQDHLRGVIPDALPISIRQLLQHTSGLADYHDYDGLDSAAAYDQRRFDDPSAEESIALALPHSPLFPAGTSRLYTDTNYRVLELLVPAVTGHSIAYEIRQRILRPLHLSATSYPLGDGEIQGPHLHGYMASDLPEEPFGNQSELLDMTVETIDQTGAGGALISSADDLVRFFRALLSGKLLPKAQLDAMMQTVAPDEDEAGAGATGYGLGLVRWDLGCGTFWGHGGSIRGYTTLVYAAADDSRQVVLEITQSRLPDASLEPIFIALDRAVCGS